MYEYADKWGNHSHEVSVPGRAYDPSAPMTGPACLDKRAHYRLELCQQYGWNRWPEECSV